MTARDEARAGREPNPGAGSPELERLADAARRVIDLCVRSTVGPEEMDQAAQALETAAGHLAPATRTGAFVPSLTPLGTDAQPHPYNPVIGRGNPLAPPVAFETADGGVWATVTLGSAYEGPPGYVHGGVSSLLLDHALGTANSVAGHPGMTVHLGLRYRRPTPLFKPLEIRARLDRVEGRKAFTSGEILADGKVTVAAEGVFVALAAGQARRIFTALAEESGVQRP